MELTVRDVASLLGLPEQAVYRMAQSGQLPAYQVDSQTRFNNADLLDWVIANKPEMALRVHSQLAGCVHGQPQIVEALAAGGVFHGIAGSDRLAVIRAVANLLPVPKTIDRETVFQMMWTREAEASTAIGDGIAIPHASYPIVFQIDRPIVTLCFLEHPVDFGAGDGKHVSTLFALVCPTARQHLSMLAQLASALGNEAFKGAVLEHAPRERILSLLAAAIVSSTTAVPGEDKGIER
ncbi:MAG: PTS sugar transporter subunit IIA [Deltaproteobacteria bacterium]|nr:PTS sugar transporter subunit IIA [Deltaproteobacteria bacterium]